MQNQAKLDAQNYNYDDEEMTQEEWEAYLAGLEASRTSVAPEFGGVPVNMPSNPLDAPAKEGLVDSILRGFREQNERMAQSAYSPMGGVSTPSTATQNTSSFGARLASNFSDDAIMERMAAARGEPSVAVFSDDPFGVTPEEIAAAGNDNFGKAVAENPYRSQYGVNSLDQKAIGKIQPQGAAAPQVQAPQGLTTAGGQPLAEFLAGDDAAPSQKLDAQGRMIDPGVDRSAFEKASADREARQAARPSFNEVRRDGDTGDGAPTALFKKEAEAAGLSGRAKSEFVSERSRAWSEAREDREISKASGQAAAKKSAAELAIKVSAENRELTEDEKKYGIELSTAAGALNSLKADLDLVRGKGEEISTLSQKSLTEGLLGKAISKISPTSSAAQLERASGVLTGDAFIKGMQVIKEFGGGLGSVTEVEGLKVERAQGAIFEAGMSGEERRAAVKNYIEVRENAYNRIHSQFVKQYGAEEASQYLGDPSGGAGQSSRSGSRYPDDQDYGAKVETYFQGN